MVLPEGAIPTKTARVAHLNGTIVSYHLAAKISSVKPTLVLINSFASCATLFRPQLKDATLIDGMNMLVVEPLGHGGTRAGTPSFSYWDSATVILQLLDVLGIKKAFVFGVSQGGWIAARMALYAPERISGLIFASTTMLGSTRPPNPGQPSLTEAAKPTLEMTATGSADWALPAVFAPGFLNLSFGPGKLSEADMVTWSALLSQHYAGDPGRLRLRQALINLLSNDTLAYRLGAIACPVLWVQGGADPAHSDQAVEEELALFGSAEKRFEVVQGGMHLFTYTHSEGFNPLLAEFMTKYGGKTNPRAMREAVGMVEM